MIRRLLPAGAAALACCLAFQVAPAAHAADSQPSTGGGMTAESGPEAAAPSAAAARFRACLTAAAGAHRLAPAILAVLLGMEGGTLGRVSRNTNGTVDIGPMQVNSTWVPQMAGRWNTTPEAAYAALRDNLCANLEGGAWILRAALDEAKGDFWSGVGIYHSHTPQHQQRYLRGVLGWARRLQAQARRTVEQDAPMPASAPPTTARPAPLDGPPAPSHSRLASRG